MIFYSIFRFSFISYLSFSCPSFYNLFSLFSSPLCLTLCSMSVSFLSLSLPPRHQGHLFFFFLFSTPNWQWCWDRQWLRRALAVEIDVWRWRVVVIEINVSVLGLWVAGCWDRRVLWVVGVGGSGGGLRL